MASIIKRTWTDDQGRPQVRWDVYVGRKGTRRKSKTFQTKTAASRWMTMVEAEIERGGFKSTDDAERMTFSEAMQLYAEQELPRMKGRRADESNIRMLDRHLGTHPVISIDGAVLAQYQRKRLAMRATSVRTYPDGTRKVVLLGRFIANNTVRHELALVSRVFTYLIKQCGMHLPAGNPVRLVKLPPMGRGRDRRLTKDEEERLLAVVDPRNARPGHARNPFMHPIIVFALETTCRRGEIVKLRWADVDLDRRTALLRDTKNGTDRAIGLSSRAVAALAGVPRSKDERVFPLTANAVRLAWQRALRQAKIEGLRFHDLRHEATSRLAGKFNGDLLALSAMTGHKSLQMLKRYTHLRPEDLAARLG